MDTTTYATSREVLERFLASYWTTRTRDNYRFILTRWLDWCHARGHDPVGGVDAAALESFIAELEMAGYAPNTIVGRVSAVPEDLILTRLARNPEIHLRATTSRQAGTGCRDTDKHCWNAHNRDFCHAGRTTVLVTCSRSTFHSAS